MINFSFNILPQTFPVMYVLMTMDSEEAYAEIFKYLRQLAPEFIPQAIITGFDLSMQRAAQQVFGSACLIPTI